jgi:hypothetical protein
MDKHEKGIEKQHGRVDLPLPEWQGSYAGDAKRLPKVVQKLVHGRTLTAEEKAELLWRMFELDQRSRERRAKARAWVLGLSLIAVAVYVGVYHRVWVAEQIMAWLSPPAGPSA